jgi:hypothetical protein
MKRIGITATIILIAFIFWVGFDQAKAAARPAYLIAFVPVSWSGSQAEFERAARHEGEYFIRESGIQQYADVEFVFLQPGLPNADLTKSSVIFDMIQYGMMNQPADRYVGLTNGDIKLNGDSSVVGFTYGFDSVGVMVEVGFGMVLAHELGHTFGLCDEYFYPYWVRQDIQYSCPNPFPSNCLKSSYFICDGMPAQNGNRSIMGTATNQPTSFNQPCYDHLQLVFSQLFAPGGPQAPPQDDTPTPVPPSPPPVEPKLILQLYLAVNL